MENNKTEIIDLNAKKEEKVELENTITLSRPVTVEGETYEKLVLDFEKLTGSDVELAEMQFVAENPQNGIVMVKEMSKGFCAIVAARAAGVHVSVVRALSAADYSKVTMRASVFLMSGK